MDNEERDALRVGAYAIEVVSAYQSKDGQWLEIALKNYMDQFRQGTIRFAPRIVNRKICETKQDVEEAVGVDCCKFCGHHADSHDVLPDDACRECTCIGYGPK